MKTAKILFWIAGKTDSRDTAGNVAEITVPQNRAVVAARAIEGDHAWLADHHDILALVTAALKKADAQFPSCAPYRVPTGHGVTIQYASGRIRNVRRDW